MTIFIYLDIDIYKLTHLVKCLQVQNKSYGKVYWAKLTGEIYLDSD